LNPVSGAISGNGTIGWGFTLTNDMNFIKVVLSDFCSGTGNDQFSTPCDTSQLGHYQDFIANYSGAHSVVVGPTATNPGDTTSFMQSFNNMAMTGVGSYTIDNPSAMMGDMVSGQILLEYDLFSRSPNDPSFNARTDTIATSQFVVVTASVTDVPEPGTLFLLGTAFAGLGVARFRRRKQS
jgi:hypothetical protein